MIFFFYEFGMKRFFLLLFVILMATEVFSQSLTVEVSGIRNNRGVIRLAFFVSEEQFRHESPEQERYYNKDRIIDGKLVVRVDSLLNDNYGIALLDDENRNCRLDYILLLPREGVGFSNYWHSGIRKPRFSKFCFDLTKGYNQRVMIRVHYY